MTDKTATYISVFITCALVGGVSFAFGRGFGAHEAAERFYEHCQGGEVFFDETGLGEVHHVAGCAEIARKIK